MKQITRFLVAPLFLTAFAAVQAQDIADSAVDPFSGPGSYAGNPSFPGVGDYDPNVLSTGAFPGTAGGVSPGYAPQAGAGTAAFREEGIASWYGTEFEGHPTASGELFNPAQLTAAHPSLPFGTMLRVTNTQNNRQVTVRVNDRGPFVNTRIIDVSRAAAEALDILTTGTAPVVVELAGELFTAAPPAASFPATSPAEQTPPWIQPPAASFPATSPAEQTPPWIQPPAASFPATPPAEQTPPWLQPPAASFPATSPAEQTPPWLQPLATPLPATSPAEQAPPPAMSDPNAAVVRPGIPPMGTTKRYSVQVGAYKVSRNAVDTFDRIKSLGLEPSYERHEDYYRVVLSGVRAEDIQSLAGRLGSIGFREVLIREE